MQTRLKRSLSLALVTLYGLGTILGAGIYILIGAVAGAAGVFAPIAFLLAALIAGVSAFSYAELSARFPRSAGEALYVDIAFKRGVFSLLMGLAVVVVGMVSSATIVNGFAAYLQVFMPVADWIAISGIVVAMGALAAIGIGISAWAAAAITLIEMAGLLLVIVVAGDDMISEQALSALSPGADWMLWGGIMAGAFLAFYAFIGFEDIVNVAEEVREPEKNLPIAIILALSIATVLYFLVALTAVTAVPTDQLSTSEAPLALIVQAHGLDPRIIAGISLLAVVNGALVQIIMASRVLYGMARQGRLPNGLGQVHPRFRTPVRATALVTVLILVLALALPLVRLAAITSLVTLLIFAAVNAALIRIRLRDGRPAESISYPIWIPCLGLLLSLVLVGVELLN